MSVMTVALRAAAKECDELKAERDANIEVIKECMARLKIAAAERDRLDSTLQAVAKIVCSRRNLERGDPRATTEAGIYTNTPIPEKATHAEIIDYTEGIDRLLRAHDTDACGYKLDRDRLRALLERAESALSVCLETTVSMPDFSPVNVLADIRKELGK